MSSRPKRARKAVSYVEKSEDDSDIEEIRDSSGSDDDNGSDSDAEVLSSSDDDKDEDDTPSTKGKKKKKKAAKQNKRKAAARAKKGKAPKSSSGKRSRNTGLQSKSPAEFFAENQNIAGFDNPGKALYTTIREFVENSLDAAESMGRLPTISVCVEEIGSKGLDKMRGVNSRERQDHGLYAVDRPEAKRRRIDSPAAVASSAPASQVDGSPSPAQQFPVPTKAGKKRRAKRSDVSVFRVTCKDNGTGMPHVEVPNMLGRVLSGSNYGLRQTRGKFGLGSKMALIWAKKSTGMPIEVRTAHCKDKDAVASHVTYCKLDIDILRNKPKVIEHTLTPNDGRVQPKRASPDGSDGGGDGDTAAEPMVVDLDREEQDGAGGASSAAGESRGEPWRGTEISVIIEGNWPSYQSYIRRYFGELAVVTPYAELELEYTNWSNPSKALYLRYERRSGRIPRLAAEVKHHPKSVNNLTVRQLIDREENRKKTLLQFLSKEFQSISKPMAKRLIAELGYEPTRKIRTLGTVDVHAITQLLKAAKLPDPSGNCLSPAGEYNLKLGIMKEFGLDSRCVRLLAFCFRFTVTVQSKEFISNTLTHVTCF